MSTSQVKKLFTYLFLSIFVIYFVFSGVIQIPFYHHDIYKYSHGGLGVSCENEIGFAFLFDIVRPFTAYFDCSNFKLGSTLSNMSHIRLFCAVFAGFIMGLFAYWLELSLFPFWTAFFISGAIFLLPGIQTVMAMGASFWLWSVMMAMVANWLINYGCESRKYITVLAGIICLFVSFFTYPPATLFFLVPTLILILFQPLNSWGRARVIFVRNIIFFLGVNLVFFFYAKYVQHKRMGNDFEHAQKAYKYTLNWNLGDRFVTLYHQFPVLWNLYIGKLQFVIVYGLIFIGMVIAMLRFYRSQHKSIKVLMQNIGAVIILLGLGSSFYLLQPENVTFGRIIFVFQAMASVILIWSLWQISQVFKKFNKEIFAVYLGILFFMAAGFASRTTTLSALDDNMELNYITSSIANEMLIKKNKITRIHIISSHESDTCSFSGLAPREDIFNRDCTRIPDDIIHMINTALLQLFVTSPYTLVNCVVTNPDKDIQATDEKKCLAAASPDAIVVTLSASGNEVNASPNMLVIDMNALSAINAAPKSVLPKD